MDDLKQKLIVQSLSDFASDLRHCDTMAVAVCTVGLALGSALIGASFSAKAGPDATTGFLIYALFTTGLATFALSGLIGLRVHYIRSSILSLDKTLMGDVQLTSYTPYARLIAGQSKLVAPYLYMVPLAVSFFIICVAIDVLSLHLARG